MPATTPNFPPPGVGAHRCQGLSGTLPSKCGQRPPHQCQRGASEEHRLSGSSQTYTLDFAAQQGLQVAACAHGSEKPWAAMPLGPENDVTGSPSTTTACLCVLGAGPDHSLGGRGKALGLLEKRELQLVSVMSHSGFLKESPCAKGWAG